MLRYASVCGLGGTAVSARLCATLQEAATEPYFYEALFDFSRRTRPTRRYKRWRAARDRAMEAGRVVLATTLSGANYVRGHLIIVQIRPGTWYEYQHLGSFLDAESRCDGQKHS